MRIFTVLLSFARLECILTPKGRKSNVLDKLMIHFGQLLANYSRYAENLNMKFTHPAYAGFIKKNENY